MIKFKKESRNEIKNKNNYPPTRNFSLLSTYWAIYFRILKEAEKRDKLDQAKREREAKHVYITTFLLNDSFHSLTILQI